MLALNRSRLHAVVVKDMPDRGGHLHGILSVVDGGMHSCNRLALRKLPDVELSDTQKSFDGTECFPDFFY